MDTSQRRFPPKFFVARGEEQSDLLNLQRSASGNIAEALTSLCPEGCGSDRTARPERRNWLGRRALVGEFRGNCDRSADRGICAVRPRDRALVARLQRRRSTG